MPGQYATLKVLSYQHHAWQCRTVHRLLVSLNAQQHRRTVHMASSTPTRVVLTRGALTYDFITSVS